MFSLFKKKIIVPHVRLTGVIGSAGRFRQGIDFSGQQEIIKKAFSFKKAKNIAISINSPGGSPVQSHLIHDYIRQLAVKNKKKVIVFAEDVAASGGYLIACAGDEIYANSSSIVGSIGVISASFGFQDAIKKIGIQRRVYTAGKNKSTLDPFKEEKEEDIQRIKKLQLELHSDFINLVKKSRGSKLKDAEKNNIFTGEFWSGSTSLKLGLIDGIGNAEQILREKFGENIVIERQNLDIPNDSMAVVVPSINKNNPKITRFLPKPLALRIDKSKVQERCSYNFEIRGSTTSYQGDFPFAMSKLNRGSLLSFDNLKKDNQKNIYSLLLLMHLSNDAENNSSHWIDFFNIQENKVSQLMLGVAGVVGFEPTVHGIKTRGYCNQELSVFS